MIQSVLTNAKKIMKKTELICIEVFWEGVKEIVPATDPPGYILVKAHCMKEKKTIEDGEILQDWCQLEEVDDEDN